jgi:hypothetical protein
MDSNGDANSNALALPKFTLPFENLNWDELLIDWRPLIPAAARPWMLTKFGELFFAHADGKIGMLRVSDFSYEIVAKHETDFFEWLVDPDKMTEWFLAPLLESMDLAGKKLDAGQCYSFITPLGLGGTLKRDNVMVIPITHHFKCFGEVFREIKDLPDGAQVQFKIMP